MEIHILWGIVTMAALLQEALPDWLSFETQIMEIPVDRDRWEVPIPQEDRIGYIRPIEAMFGPSLELDPTVIVDLTFHKWGWNVRHPQGGRYDFACGSVIRYPGDKGLVVYWMRHDRFAY